MPSDDQGPTLTHLRSKVQSFPPSPCSRAHELPACPHGSSPFRGETRPGSGGGVSGEEERQTDLCDLKTNRHGMAGMVNIKLMCGVYGS